jgi:SAM-dependent methyltransferase
MNCRWLDIGCGTGGSLTMMQALAPALVAGVDLSPDALAIAREQAPSATVVGADINQALPFPDASFDAITIFNVLYHQWVQSEVYVLSEAARVLRLGGLLLITEPAFDALRREMDDAVMTRRRYRLKDFDPWLKAAGFQHLFASYFTSFGVPILLAAKYLRPKREDARQHAEALDLRPISTPLNETLAFAASVEGWILSRGLRLPFGTTLLRVARRLT